MLEMDGFNEELPYVIIKLGLCNASDIGADCLLFHLHQINLRAFCDIKVEMKC